MDRFESLRLFTRIVELGSFSRAAELLEIPRATATHAIKELESSLGSRLLERSTRHVRPTLDGHAFYERCIQVLDDLEEAESVLRHISTNPRGVLRVDMHGTHATRIILPRINEFRSLYPNIDLVISSTDRLVDLVREGIDCVIRAGVPKDSSLVARRLAAMPQVICASPEYLAFFGTPEHPSELSSHQAVKFFSSNGYTDYPFTLIEDGQACDFQIGGWLSVNYAENYVIAALQGCGLIQLPRFHVEEYLHDGRLIEVLPNWRSPDMCLSVLYPYRKHLSRRVKVFIDWIESLYKQKFNPMNDQD